MIVLLRPHLSCNKHLLNCAVVKNAGVHPSRGMDRVNGRMSETEELHQSKK